MQHMPERRDGNSLDMVRSKRNILMRKRPRNKALFTIGLSCSSGNCAAQGNRTDYDQTTGNKLISLNGWTLKKRRTGKLSHAAPGVVITSIRYCSTGSQERQHNA